MSSAGGTGSSDAASDEQTSNSGSWYVINSQIGEERIHFISLDDLGMNPSIFIEAIYGAKPMITIGNN